MKLIATLITNIKYLLPDCQNWVIGDILVEDGKFSALGTIDKEGRRFDEIIDGANKLVIPGLINAHAHSYTGYLKGSIDNVPLDIYMLFAIAGGSFRTPREIYISTMIEALQMLKNGTTYVTDHFSERPMQTAQGLDAAAKAFSDLGMKATIAPMFADKSFFDTVPMEQGELPDTLRGSSSGRAQTPEEYIDLVEYSIKKYNHEDSMIQITLGTDGAQRCSQKLLELTGQLEEKYKAGWHTHVLEAKTQAIVSQKQYGTGLISYMNSLGLLNSRTSLVHYIWASEEEQQLVSDKGCSVIHCPSSALHLGSGIAPIDKIIHLNSVAIGTDGGNCGNLSMLEKIKMTALLHKPAQPDFTKWISASDALRMCYQGGAKAVHQQNHIGAVQLGFDADFALIDINNVLWQPAAHLTEQLVYGEHGNHVDTVFIKGKKVLENGKSLLVNKQEIIEEAKELYKKITRDTAGAMKLVHKQIPVFQKMYQREIQRDIGYNRFIRPL